MLNMRLSSAIYPSRNAHVQLIVGGMYTPLLHGQNSSFLTVGSLYIMAPKFNHGRNSKIMVFQLMLVAVVAFLLGFVSLYSFRRKKKDRALVKDRNVNGWRSSENGMCLQKDIGAGVDVIIVGAGVAGSALAYTLGKDGRRVHVIERDLTKPDRIVGELLQPGAYLRLIELGLEDCVNKIDAQQIFGYVLYKDGIRTKLPYPLENFNPDVVGVSFHHGRFIQRMRDKASSLPNVKLEQGTVTSLLEEKGTIKGVKFRRKGSQEFTAQAPLTIVCDGCCSNLRRYLCNPKVDIPSCFVGLILEDCRLPYANHAHVILGDPSLVAFYPIGSREIRCLVDVPGRQVPSLSSGEMAHYLKTKVAPQVPPELYTPFLVAIDKGNIKTMPARSMPATPHRTPGALLMGDAVNMRHPITGGGMVVALSDVVVLRNLLRPMRNLNDVPALVKDLESFYTLRKPAAFTINTLAGAAYKVLCASPDPARKELRQACFDYFCLGRVFSNGALATFSGLNYCPWSLVLHFFVVGIYAVGRLLIPFPSPKRIWIAARLILEALRIMLPIINAEGVRQMFFPARRFPPV